MGPEAFDYVLPLAQIARHPPPTRTEARMMVVGDERPHRVSDLPRVLPPGALVVMNRSAVVPARLLMRRVRDDRVFELLVCAPGANAPKVLAWARKARALRSGDVLEAAGDPPLQLRYCADERAPHDPRARVFERLAGNVLEACTQSGEVPLPPYLGRPAESVDRARYQTVFASDPGSVAAPTAGLHFDDVLIAAIRPVFLTLHVGPGTFLPIEAQDVRDHRVPPEAVEIDAEAAHAIGVARAEGRPIVAVGTTVTRALEGVFATCGVIEPFSGTTDVVIGPGHMFAVVTHLLTNFHLPRSSLLMLTCAFGGMTRVMAAYERAVSQQFRFYSYGDCMFLSKAESL